MNKKSKALQMRNQSIQEQYIHLLAQTKTTNEPVTILQIQTILAVENDLSVERIRQIVNYRRI